MTNTFYFILVPQGMRISVPTTIPQQIAYLTTSTPVTFQQVPIINSQVGILVVFETLSHDKIELCDFYLPCLICLGFESTSVAVKKCWWNAEAIKHWRGWTYITSSSISRWIRSRILTEANICVCAHHLAKDFSAS